MVPRKPINPIRPKLLNIITKVESELNDSFSPLRKDAFVPSPSPVPSRILPMPAEVDISNISLHFSIRPSLKPDDVPSRPVIIGFDIMMKKSAPTKGITNLIDRSDLTKRGTIMPKIVIMQASIPARPPVKIASAVKIIVQVSALLSLAEKRNNAKDARTIEYKIGFPKIPFARAPKKVEPNCPGKKYT